MCGTSASSEPNVTTRSTREVARETEDELRERLPAQVRLGAEQDHGVPPGARDLGVEEPVLRPIELARQPVLEGDVRACRLEVVEVLGIDLREPLTRPLLREVARREGSALPAVVPAAERGDENRASQTRHERDVQLGHRPILRAVRRHRTPQPGDEPDSPGEDACGHRDVRENEPPRQAVPVLRLADGHLDAEQDQQARTSA